MRRSDASSLTGWPRRGVSREMGAGLCDPGSADAGSGVRPGLFIGLDDEWNGGWGRPEPDLEAEAVQELDRLLYGGEGADSTGTP